MSPRAAARDLRGRRVVVIARRGRFAVARPLFEPGPQIGLAKGSADVKPGRMALAEIGRRGARILRTLGSPKRARDVVEALMLDRGLNRGFRDRVRAEATEAATSAGEHPGRRRDLTELATFTVDPATARDFDDAVSARTEGDAVRLWIHIADVAAHVRPGSALEAEAYARANSTYVPGAVEPMLPPALSSDACSLAPGVARLAVTAEIVISGGGRPASASFYRSRIRSDARLHYDQLDEIFAGRDSPPEAVAAPLELARGVAAALAGRRPGSAVVVSGSEPEFYFEDGAVAGAREVSQTEAHRLIEHLMILCNEQVARLLEQRRVPTLYRVHEQPDPQRVSYLVEQLAALGIPTPPVPDVIGPTEAGELVGAASRLVAAEAKRRGHGREAYTTLVLRSLQQAVYSERNLGHAGLGSAAYAHFTSPIRRYPDLVVHRGLLSAIGEGEEGPDPLQAREAAWHCSQREREAVRIERDADSVCAAFLLERELFESGWEREFEGEVSGLVGAGAFVRFGGELADVYEGFLPARLLRGEYFELNETETALVGRRSGRALSLGDPVEVQVDSVEAPRGRVDLVPLADVEEGSPRRRGARTGGRQ
ncbi:MAG TPA: RNB domain-containing ribonuclease [Solirubrobacterales bacterium]|nr:RNB domain-containing ribonuclease [Solirubrobacterales bacterium]